ncbi:MAG TPA: proton-conducting transporter membrane subunit, partial [Gaiellaceae bacterium]|nr:proton-conducting transporter membrane subunit [Gaiellaceae bacterium]
MTAVFEVGLLALVAGVALPLLSPRAGLLAAFAGSVLLAIVGFGSAAHWTQATIHLGSWLGFGPSALVSDRLAGIFLALTGVTGAAVSLAFCERPPSRFVAAVHALMLLAAAAVIGADQAFVFLLAWETITLSIYLIAGADRERPGTLVAAYFGTGLGKIGGACTLAAFALLYGRTGSFELAVWAHAGASLGSARSVAFVLLLIGFGSKIGVLPLQGALPPLYAAAPGAASATISVAYNAGFYGLWRLVFATLAPGPAWWGEVLIVLGGLGALVGILYAVAQDEIKRFLGFSSVEHGGIVLLGFGVALLGQSAHEPNLAAAGLLAATLHLIVHGVAKTLAFLGADRIGDGAGSGTMRPLGGLASTMPRTALGFGIAVLTLAAMPPFGGFVSEWFTLEALLQGFRLDGTVARLVMALGGAMLALTAGIGLLAFAKLFGGVFLGRARTALHGVHEGKPALGFAALAAVVSVLGVVAPWEIRWLGHGLEGLLGFDLAGSTISFPLVLGPVYRHFSVLAPTWLALGIVAFAAAAAILVRALLRPPVRSAPVWVSGTAADVALVQYTPDAYANPIRVVL